jgi:hypothetical protein
MSDAHIRETVKEQYGQAALRVVAGDRGAAAVPARAPAGAIPSARISTMPVRPPRFPRVPSRPRSGAAIPRHWRASTKGKPCSTWGQEGNRRTALGPARRPNREATAWT